MPSRRAIGRDLAFAAPPYPAESHPTFTAEFGSLMRRNSGRGGRTGRSARLLRPGQVRSGEFPLNSLGPGLAYVCRCMRLSQVSSRG
jgi:hypothetical protein